MPIHDKNCIQNSAKETGAVTGADEGQTMIKINTPGETARNKQAYIKHIPMFPRFWT